jgi:hypothetical protein
MFAMLGGMKMAIIGLAALAISGIIYAGYNYVTALQQANSQLEADKAKLNIAVDLKTAENESLMAGIAAMAKESVALNEKLDKTRAERRKAKRIFDDHEFTKLLQAKPGLVERRMVSGTDRMFRALEQASND